MFTVSVIKEDNSSQQVSCDKLPDECPICHKKVIPTSYGGFLGAVMPYTTMLQIIYRCPNENCRHAFIGFYRCTLPSSNDFSFEYSKPAEFIPRKFSEIISAISPDFVIIYNQAFAAEQAELTVICGAGYRKALEFLIKDYLISSISEDAEKDKIKGEFLGKLIEKRVDHPQLKAVVKRAVWLGNDETHYERKWQNKDISDLKSLIDLTLHWVETNKLTEKLLQEMPEEK